MRRCNSPPVQRDGHFCGKVETCGWFILAAPPSISAQLCAQYPSNLPAGHLMARQHPALKSLHPALRPETGIQKRSWSMSQAFLARVSFPKPSSTATRPGKSTGIVFFRQVAGTGAVARLSIHRGFMVFGGNVEETLNRRRRGSMAGISL